jgi:hypothetical protein
MAESFEFSHTKIDDHIEKVGIDIRPAIEIKLDRDKLYRFGLELIDAYPQLFESLVQSPVDYRITKKFIFPGKGEAEMPTLAFTPRGLMFAFPRRLAALDEELELGDVDDVLLDCLKKFRANFSEKVIIRVGLVNEYVFATGAISGAKIICDRFTKLTAPASDEIRLRINLANDDFNRTIEMEAVRKLEQVAEIPGRTQPIGYGIKVTVDLNNRDMNKNLDRGSIMTILHEGRTFNKRDLYRFLNGTEGEA